MRLSNVGTNINKSSSSEINKMNTKKLRIYSGSTFQLENIKFFVTFIKRKKRNKSDLFSRLM